jgi:acyl-coenzyme A synthetase/AMP-(fatty) acid ligase
LAVKLAPFGRRNRAVAIELADLSPLEAALHPALESGRWRIPDRFNFTRDVIEVLAEDPKRRALMCLGVEGVIEPRTFHQLADAASRWASQLRERGVGEGDCILVLVASKLAWIEVMLAGIKVGAVTVPCPPTLSSAALDIRIASTGAKLVVAERSSGLDLVEAEGRPAVLYSEDVDSLPPQHSWDEPSADTSSRDLAFVLSTSGTAFGPHGVAHTHGAAYAARAQAEHWLDASAHDVVWCTSDTGSALSVWNVLLGPWSQGAEIVIHDGAFSAEERLDLIRRLDVTILCQSPSEYRALAEQGQGVLERHRAPLLRRLVSTGDVASPDVAVTFMDAWGLPIHDGYSTAECGVVAGWGPGTEPRAGCVGMALPGQEVVVVDASGNELPPGTEGDLAVRGRPPTMFSGYWQAADETKATFRGDLYVTGDIATIDQDGRIRLVGRAQDVISSGGLRFSPTEVEDSLRTHEVVADAGVVGSRDLERGGQFVRAFVVLKPRVEGTDRLVAEIRQHLRKSLPESMVPREVDFVDALPKTPNGKVRRLELRERPIARAQPAWTGAGAEPEPWKPQPEIAPEPEPVVIEEVEEEDELLPDYVVPRAQTLAASLEPEPAADAAVADDGPGEDAGDELPDYIVQSDPEVDPLPDYVTSFLRSEPLTDIEHPVPIETPRTSQPNLAPDGKFETKPEPRLDPRLMPTAPEQDLERIMFAPAGEAAPTAPADPPQDPPAADPPAADPPEPEKPKFTVIPRPIEKPRPYPTRGRQPEPEPKPQPQPEPEPPPEPDAPAEPAPSPAPPEDVVPTTSRPTGRAAPAARPPAPSPAPPAADPLPVDAKQRASKPKAPEAATPREQAAAAPKPAAAAKPKPPQSKPPQPKPPQPARAPERAKAPDPPKAAEVPKAPEKPVPPQKAKVPEKPRIPEKAIPEKAIPEKPAAVAKPAPKPASPKPAPRPAPKTAPSSSSASASKPASKPASTPVPKPPRKPAARPAAKAAPKAKPAVAAAAPPASVTPPAAPAPAPVPDLATVLDPEHAVEKSAAKRGRLGRKKKEPETTADAKQRSRFSRSAPEPGMENQDVSFMEGLSSRLSAYSVSADEDVAIPMAKPSPDGDSGESG